MKEIHNVFSWCNGNINKLNLQLGTTFTKLCKLLPIYSKVKRTLLLKKLFLEILTINYLEKNNEKFSVQSSHSL